MKYIIPFNIKDRVDNPIFLYTAKKISDELIATKGGGNNELVKDGNTGYLIQNPSIQEIYKKIKLLIDNKTLAINLW